MTVSDPALNWWFEHYSTVIFWGDPSPPIRDYVTYGQPLMDIELLLHVAPFLYLPPRSHPFLEVLERLVTLKIGTPVTGAQWPA